MSERTAPSAAFSRLPSLTGLRFVAALLVFFTHLSVEGYLAPGPASTVFRYAFGLGWVGVEFFFILSGFVLTWSARQDDSRSRFWRRRLVKIFPTHLLTWLAALLLALWAGETLTGGRLLPSLFLVHAWVPELDVMRAVNLPSWSLSCELAFYLAFPWLRALTDRIRADRLWAWVLGVTAVIVLLPFADDAFVPGSPRLPGLEMSLLQNWFLVALPAVRALDFVLGVLLARIVLAGRWIPLGLPAAAVLVAAGTALQLALVPTVYGFTATVALPLALLVAAAAQADVLGKASPFRSRTAVRLGEISFAFYMTHHLVLHYVRVALGETRVWSVPAVVGLGAVLLVATIGMSWLSYRFVELPAVRRWSDPAVRPGGPEPVCVGGLAGTSTPS
ncbi:acyltransferase [Kitasatospora sp. NBC_00240]|uniref:acyltransferase family protein n=1 Tax=Kitasatospora sp. NBC_00240 TaxID=2903567 RepID=UPI0022570849|nr:acyltransferase [Kitasatospora sp. NBC_00240]MCX5208616.1 acyltransferase [Kitasatospora sp. NBC_00240]